MNNVFISSAKKNEVVENFVKSKREELEKMIPGFIGDRKFTDIMLNFYERGIRDGVQMMLDTLDVKEVDLEKLIEDYMLPISAQDVKEEPFTQLEKCAKHFFELGLKTREGE